MANDYATLNNAPVLEARLSVPRTGVWHATVVVDADTLAPIAGPLTLVLGGVSWSGALLRGSLAFGRLECRMVGGRGGLAKLVTGQCYVNVPARVPVADVLAAAGEAIDPGADATALGKQLPAWTRLGGRASHQLAALAHELAVTWRISPAGLVWLGTDVFAPSPATAYDVLARKPARGSFTVAGDDAPTVLPGTTLEGAKVAFVEHMVADGALRTEVYAADG